jgi:hypothetical protein
MQRWSIRTQLSMGGLVASQVQFLVLYSFIRRQHCRGEEWGSLFSGYCDLDRPNGPRFEGTA